MSDKKIPTGVKSLSILYYIGAVLGAIMGIISMFTIGTIILLVPFLAGFGFFLVILIFGISILSFFTARGLWKGQNWAKIITIVFAGLGIVTSLITIFTVGIIALTGSIINIIIGGLIAGYLLFNKEVKKFFK